MSRLHLSLIIAACVASVVLTIVRRAHVSSPEAFATIAEKTRAEYRAGDLIVVVPFHQSTPRLLLGDLPLVESRVFEPETLRLHERILLVSVDAIGGRADLVRDIVGLGTSSVIAEADGVRLTRVDVTAPSHPIFHLDTAGTTTTVGDGPHACVMRRGVVTLPDEVSGSALVIGYGLPYAMRRTSDRLSVQGQELAVTHDWQVTRLPFARQLVVGDACIDIWVIE